MGSWWRAKETRRLSVVVVFVVVVVVFVVVLVVEVGVVEKEQS